MSIRTGEAAAESSDGINLMVRPQRRKRCEVMRERCGSGAGDVREMCGRYAGEVREWCGAQEVRARSRRSSRRSLDPLFCQEAQVS